jgi:hypothetical protein
VGFDLIAKKPAGAAWGYFGANVFWMSALRCAMRAAGVREELVYGKFLYNDGRLVTPLQAKTVAEKLTAWLKGRNLLLDCRETDECAVRVNNEVAMFLAAFEKKAGRRRSRQREPGSMVFKVDPRIRKWLRRFIRFCENSGGFWVE